jgi:hypothetical protein
VAAFIKNLTRLLGGGKPEAELYLAAFGKHPGWNDHTDDMGLDTEALVEAKRLLYVQGIGQNIDAGAWDKLEPSTPGEPPGVGRLEEFRHDFLGHMSEQPSILLAGRLWSSLDGKGRDKYPMVLCSQLNELPLRFAADVVFPFLTQVQERCVAATSAAAVRELVDSERIQLRMRINDVRAPLPLSAREMLRVATHPDMNATGGGREGFYRVVYQFVSSMSAYRPMAGSSTSSRYLPKRAEQIRVPACGLPPQEALHFWLRFALTFLAASTPILLFAPDLGSSTAWVDLIVGDATPANVFCIKAGTRALPLTSDIPYTLAPAFVKSMDQYLAACESAAAGGGASGDGVLPPWPV